MTDDEKLVSLSGSPIYRHEEPAADHSVENEGRFLDEIDRHIERHLGPIDSVFHEITSAYAHIDVHWVPPNAKREFQTLVTSGMSDRPMQTPEGEDVPSLVELFVTLPPDWPIGQAEFEDEANYWPVRQLKYLARFPHAFGTWLGYGHTIPNGDPPEPFAETTDFCGSLILPSPSVVGEFDTLSTASGEHLSFFSVVPLFAGEMELKLRRGVDALLDLFDRKGVTDLIDSSREEVRPKRWWKPFGS
jgi:hypothetical protein